MSKYSTSFIIFKSIFFRSSTLPVTEYLYFRFSVFIATDWFIYTCDNGVDFTHADLSRLLHSVSHSKRGCTQAIWNKS